MLNGYVTYEELKLITGFNDKLLKTLLINGMSQHEIGIESARKKYLNEVLFNLEEVQKWISIHIW